MNHPQTDAPTETASDAGEYRVYWREIDTDEIRLSRMLIVQGESTLADAATMIAIRDLPIDRMQAERVVILRTIKVDGGDQ